MLQFLWETQRQLQGSMKVPEEGLVLTEASGVPEEIKGLLRSFR